MIYIWCKFHDPRSWPSRSNRGQKVKILGFVYLFCVCSYSSGTIIGRRSPKKAIESSWNALSLMCPQNWPQVNGLGSRGHQRSETSFLGKHVFGDNFLIMQPSKMILIPSCFSRRDGSNGISFDLKRSILKFDLRSRSRSRSNGSLGSWCISLDSYGGDKHNDTTFTLLPPSSGDLSPKNHRWPLMTSFWPPGALQRSLRANSQWYHWGGH